MKHLKRIAAAALAAVMVFALCISTFAATITVNSNKVGQEYSAYLIFNLETTSGTSGSGYVYYLDADSQFYDLVTAYIASNPGLLTLNATTRVNSSGVTVDTYEVQFTSSFDETAAKAFAAYLKAAIDADIAAYEADPTGYTPLYTPAATATSEQTGSGGTTIVASLTADENGYYFINTDLGSLGILDSSTGSLVVDEKNTLPTPEKEATAVNGSTSDGSVKIGDTVSYEVTVNVGEGIVQYNIIVNDTLSEGLTLTQSSIAVSDSDGNDWLLNTDYTVSVTDVLDSNDDPTGEHLLTITLLSSSNGGSYLSTLTDSTDYVTITYDTVINENAASTSNTDDGISNDVSLTYGRDGSYETETITEEVDTYRFGIQKTDGTNQLAGAVFNVWAGTDTTADPLGFVAYTGADPDYSYYRLATAEELADPTTYGVVYNLTTTDTKTILWLEGLDAGTYTLKEIEAPSGYNILDDTITVVIGDDGSRTFTYSGTSGSIRTSTTGYITITNNSGSVLPSTGGMGTRIFYTIGGILVIGAGILLITKRRMGANK